MKIHLEPIQYIIRGFKSGDFDLYDPFDFVANLVITGRGEGYLFAAQGEIDRGGWKEIYKTLTDLGLHRVTYVRHGKEKVVDLKQS